MTTKLTVCLFFVFLFNFNLNSFSQTEPRRKGYVDLHLHTTMKRYYNNTKTHADATKPELKNSNWLTDKKKSRMERKKRQAGFTGFKSYSQATYDVLDKSNATILCTSITPIEKKFASDKRVWLKIGKKLPRFKIKLRRITQLAVTNMKGKRLKEIGSPNVSSFDEFMGEYTYQKSLDSISVNHTHQTVLAKNNAHLQQLYKEKKTAIVLTLEGGHILHGLRNAANGYYNEAFCDYNCEKEIMDNIHAIKNLEHRVFFINLGHFAWNKIAGFAKTLDMAGKKMGVSLRDELQSNSVRSDQFRNTLFTKYGEGIIDTMQFDFAQQNIIQQNYDDLSIDSINKLSEIRKTNASLIGDKCHCLADSLQVSKLGWKVVDALLDTTNGQNPIYVDLKHLDYQGRRDYLNYLTVNNRKDVPVIAGHCAVAGKSKNLAPITAMCPYPDSYEELTSPEHFYLTKLHTRSTCFSPEDYQPIKSGWFYPWSINLYDEEISEIIARNGIIGITLEERVLGKDMPNYESLGRDTSGNLVKHKDFLQKHFFNKGYPLSTIDSIIVAEPFLRNMFYMVERSCTERKNCNVCDAWNHLAIGSDYDGMMNPIDICPTAAEVPNFQKFLESILIDYAAFINKSNLLCAKTPAELMDKVFFDNGEKFILRYFQK